MELAIALGHQAINGNNMKSILQKSRKYFAAMAFADVGNLTEFNRLLDESEHLKSENEEIPVDSSDGRNQLITYYRLVHR